MRQLQSVVAAAYNRAVDRSGRPAAEHRAWQELMGHCYDQASLIRDDYTVIETDDPSPYASSDAMFTDLARGRIVVSTANSEHPLWTVRENVAFRLAHDVLGHWAAHRAGILADFSFEGEYNAFVWHSRTLYDAPPRTYGPRDALFTEVVGQAAYALEFGHFGPQKVGFMW